MGCSWDRVTLGRTGLSVTPLGLGSSFGVSERDVTRAIERGVNYLYWGSIRRPAFGRAMREAARRDRGRIVTVIQTYTRVASLMRPSLERALRSLKIEYTDLLLLGWWNAPPPRRIVDAALALQAAGKARHIMISCHDRTTFAQLLADPIYGAIMVRYNAAHPGAETEVLPHARPDGAGVVAYTATRWGHLVNPRYTPAGEATPRASDCYRFSLTHPKVQVCLAGPADSEQLDEALAALDRGAMDAGELAWMKRVGVAVRASAQKGGARRFSPVDLADRIAGLVARRSNDG
jgi:aryl-alcohol dehydrogenase-like predicted oxidoreductase